MEKRRGKMNPIFSVFPLIVGYGVVAIFMVLRLSKIETATLSIIIGVCLLVGSIYALWVISKEKNQEPPISQEWEKRGRK